MKEHYATKLKRQLKEAQLDLSKTKEGLKLIAQNPNKAMTIALTTLKSVSVVPIITDVNCPRDVIYGFSGGRIDSKDISGYL